MGSALAIFRKVALAEGLSYVLLLFVAMPLKYGLGMPAGVRLMGTLHGALFVLFAASLGVTLLARQLSLKQGALAFVASLLPFGAFWFEARLRREEAAETATGAAERKAAA